MEVTSLSDIGHLHFPVLVAGAMPIVLLVGFVILAFGGKWLRGGGFFAVALSGLVAFGGLYLFCSVRILGDGYPSHHVYFDWFQIGERALSIGIVLDGTSIPMLAVVAVVTFLVHIFSLSYIQNDPQRHRYWAYLALFSAAMSGLVLADNLFLMFVFWELVGLASWFLIGFWFQKKIPAIASQKAFIVNRIADVGFIVALLLIWKTYGNFSFPFSKGDPWDWQINLLIGFCLFIAAIGKSAQFPFQIWLPDAMAGPTPVSSLIHAATMVAAGVYLLLRVEPIFPPEINILVACVGALTALMAAISALTQTDIKRVLAYSTVSQLGLMVMGIGVNAPGFAFLHLIAHAFFKCGLFLVAGAVIHNIHKAQIKEGLHFDTQDMRFMGGLRKKMPLVFVAWICFSASLAGLPFFSGFLSKDGLVNSALDFTRWHGDWAWILPGSAILTSIFTSFYITRLGVLVFLGRNRAQGVGASESFFSSFPKTDLLMLVPLLILALASTCLIFYPAHPFQFDHPFPLELLCFSLLGIGIAAFIYRKGPIPSRANALLFELSFQHFFLDRIYQGLIVKPFLAFSRWMAAFDHYVVDGLVQVVAGAILRKHSQPSTVPQSEGQPLPKTEPSTQSQASLSYALGWWDRKVVDGLVTGLANIVMRLGKRIARLQSGKLQLYIIYTLLGVLLLLLALMYIFTR